MPRASTRCPTRTPCPLLFDPCTVADPRVPLVSDSAMCWLIIPRTTSNADGEEVHRYSARSLLPTSTDEALDRPAPQRFPPPSGYPSEALEKAIGQDSTKHPQPGFRGVDLQGTPFLERVDGGGACNKPSG